MIAERLSAGHPNSAAMFVCQSRFRNSIIVTLMAERGGVGARAHVSDNVTPLPRVRKKTQRERDGLEGPSLSLAVLYSLVPRLFLTPSPPWASPVQPEEVDTWGGLLI